MITSIRLVNFKGHLATTVPLGRLTVLVGPNGAGKTSVLQALGLLTQLANDSPDAVLRDEMSPQDLCYRNRKEPITITAEGMYESGPWALSLEIPVMENGTEPKLNLRPTLMWDSSLSPAIRTQLSAAFKVAWEDYPIAQATGPAVLYRFDARQIAAASSSNEENPAVEEDGGNIAVVLAALKLEREEVFTQVETELRKIVPSVQRIRVRRVKMPKRPGDNPLETRIGNKVYIDFNGAPDVPAHGASEGTLITLALLTAICSPRRPRMLLLDDIDHALHPQAQMELMRELKGLLERFPDLQIVATTHSPYILDELEPSDVRVFAPRKNGSIACRSLAEHPQAASMSGALTTGQLWSLDPEWRWVAGES